MNLNRIKQQQLLLDKAIKEAHKINLQPKIQMMIALYTEIAEFANEVQSFKYWKKSKTIDQELMLEEYADGLHFLMSFAIELNANEMIEPLIVSNDINEQILTMFKEISSLEKSNDNAIIERLIGIYLGIAKLLDITDEQIEKAYLSKNEKNFQRIKNNY